MLVSVSVGGVLAMLSVEELQAKLQMIEDDLTLLRQEPGNDRKLEALAQYKEYIQDELKEAKNANRHRKGTK